MLRAPVRHAGVNSGEETEARIPLGRIGETSDVVAAVAFLASPGASFMTGQTLYLDGGLTATQ